MNQEKIILGIDPGTMVMGYGVIREQGKQLELITMGVINLKKLENQALKLKKIFERVLEIINEFHPDELAIEAPFFGKNVQSMLKLGRAQGVAMAAALYRDIPIFEYSPKTIKQTITGNGNASKEQVAKMVHFILKTEENPQFFDATKFFSDNMVLQQQSECKLWGWAEPGKKILVDTPWDKLNK